MPLLDLVRGDPALEKLYLSSYPCSGCTPLSQQTLSLDLPRLLSGPRIHGQEEETLWLLSRPASSMFMVPPEPPFTHPPAGHEEAGAQEFTTSTSWFSTHILLPWPSKCLPEDLGGLRTQAPGLHTQMGFMDASQGTGEGWSREERPGSCGIIPDCHLQSSSAKL